MMWGEYAVGQLVAGPDPLSPQIQPFVDEDAAPRSPKRSAAGSATGSTARWRCTSRR